MTTTLTPPRQPDPAILNAFDRDGYAVIRQAIDPALRTSLLNAAEQLLSSDITRGRDQGGDGKDGFRGCLNLHRAFLPLLANPRTLPTVVGLLSPNLHLLSAHLIALPSGPPRTIRTPERPGWHRDMYGVTADLGFDHTPRMAIKVAHYLTPITGDCGLTMFLPGSHILTEEPGIPDGAADPVGALTPDLKDGDAVLFENRTWHASGINLSGRPRIALMLQYGYRWLHPVDDPATDLLADPALSPIERQLVGMPDRNPDGSLAKGAGAAPLRSWWHSTQ
ncbi:phytanoyl-CoA dioxygenase family protein [Streptomyces scabiei]|uniref:phytanoyl-CoA dioxygenase family protein n=1 Tax=Streptomyces scabiei TaxID=1930 RepID=UPI0029A17E7B|nr:phytanoyl-CoA dioxygenase family protein [Streptomyces scabiei]MDX2576703.1 phytanoyl-CoA dioxygenase family protein [Streptomyces scabiei]MDX3029660.1 phytanoyl-CoA dioxygenase family protein [Streptomyces scabiei]MDX3204924.1 phytanoyl-CoA dioxygenase family protein [Streptomyces scabiei]